MKIPHAAPATERPIHNAIPSVAHVYGDVSSRNRPTLKSSPSLLKSISVLDPSVVWSDVDLRGDDARRTGPNNYDGEGHRRHPCVVVVTHLAVNLWREMVGSRAGLL